METYLKRTPALEPNKQTVSRYLNQLSNFYFLQKKAKAKDKEFYPLFNYVYRDFNPSLLKLAPDLIDSELRLCAYIRMDFTTKEISYYTDATCRSVESRKYRIRKKLRLQKQENLSLFIKNL